MKLMILQNMHDALGGITSVNLTLANEFIEQGHEVCICSLRNGGYGITIPYPKEVKTILINSQDEWGCPRYSQSITMMKKGNIVKGVLHLKKRLLYNRQMKQDLDSLKLTITEQNPDVIIVSHYELMDGISDAYLARTICHYHTSFDQVLGNKSQIALFNKYNEKIASFLWLSKATCEQAIAFGLTNSHYIYNPLSFKQKEQNDVEKLHQVMFLGRSSKEKRLDLLIDFFEQACIKNNINDWRLIIYASGDMDATLKERMLDSPLVEFKGKTNHAQMALQEAGIFALTSSFEGLPVVLLEAYACGIPCISFDCSESMQEILPNEVGFCIQQDDQEEYVKALADLMCDADLRKRLGNHAFTFVEQFESSNIYKEWMKLLEELNLYE